MQTVRWNGQEITRERLVEYLHLVRTMRPAIFTILDPGAEPDCAALESVRREIEGTGVCQIGGCGEGTGDWEPNAPLEIDRNSAEAQRIENEIDAALNRPQGR